VQDSLYVALSSQIALERRLSTIADNVANASTMGFRATGVKFEDVVSGAGAKSVSFTSPGDTFLSGAHGGVQQTGNPFDFAIQGGNWSPLKAIRFWTQAVRPYSSTLAADRQRRVPTVRCGKPNSLPVPLAYSASTPGRISFAMAIPVWCRRYSRSR